MNSDYDYLYKVILIGDASVGKSNILNRFVKNEFISDSKSTIGVEFATKTLILEKQRIKIQLWDTAGQERFRAVTSAYYRGAQGVVLVFDVTNRASFEHIEKWTREIRDNSDSTAVIIVVGNKIDLVEKRVVSQEECIEWASKSKTYYIETSAKQGTGIDEMFLTLTKEIYKSKKPVEDTPLIKTNVNNAKTIGVTLSQQRPAEKKKCC